MAWVLPKTVTIGHIDVIVAPMNEERSIKENLIGNYDNNEGRIEVLETLSPAKQVEVFLHEMLHAFYENLQINPRWGEEKMCDAFAMALAGVIRHNPGLFQKLEKILTKAEGSQ